MTAEASSALERRLSVELDRIRSQDLYRVRRVIEGGHGRLLTVDGRQCLNFCSNDYLGLATHPSLAQAAKRALDVDGLGSTASPLICGYNSDHRRLEEALAEFTGYPRVLLFSSGWAANCGVLRALLGRRDLLVADDLNHASLIDGGRLSGARYLRARHGDPSSFDDALCRERAECEQALVVSDSVFSMDGDLAPLPELHAIARRHDASLMVDDAHGFGVLGPTGRGAVERWSARPDIYVATLGKAAGASGAFVAGSEALIEYLIQRARSWVFSTAPPPAIAAAATTAVGLMRAEPERLQRLRDNQRRFVAGAAQLDIPLGGPVQGETPFETPIIPLLVGDSARAMALSRALFEQGCWVAGIRPPTVPKGTARLRITITAAQLEQDIDRLLDALVACGAARDSLAA